MKYEGIEERRRRGRFSMKQRRKKEAAVNVREEKTQETNAGEIRDTIIAHQHDGRC
jgi:hypothetical protein